MILVLLLIAQFQCFNCLSFVRSSKPVTFRLSSRSLQEDFMNSFGDKPIINPFAAVREKAKQQSLPPSIRTDGPIVSLEIYATVKDLQVFVVSQISNWIRQQNNKLLPSGTFSALFASVDGQRIVHAIGWKPEDNDASNEHSFNEFRKRAATTADGLPLDLKESTHVYKNVLSLPSMDTMTRFDEEAIEKYPIFSFDFYTTRLTDDHDKSRENVKEAVLSIGQKIPQLLSLHVLSTTPKDGVSHCVMASWSTMQARDGLKDIQGYVQGIENVKKYAVEGTISDMIHKTQASRLYYVADVFTP